MSLSSLIVQREIATIRQVEEALARQVLYGGDLATNLLELASIEEWRIAVTFADSFSLPAAPPGEIVLPSLEVVGVLTSETAVRRGMVPLSLTAGKLIVAAAEPLRNDDAERLFAELGVRVEVRIALEVRVREALSRAYGAPLDRRIERLLKKLAQSETTVPSPVSPRATISRPPSVPPFKLSPAYGIAAARSPLAPQNREETPGAPEVEVVVPPPPPTLTGPPRHTTQAGFPPAPPIARENQSPAAPIVVPAPHTTAEYQETKTDGAQRPTFVKPTSNSVRPARRHRGPLTVETAKEELDEAADREALLDLFFEFSRQFFDYAALFIAHGDIAEGRDAFGDGAPRERVVGIGVPLDMPSMLSSAREKKEPIVLRPTDQGIDGVLLSDLRRTAGVEAVVFPLLVRDRAVALLYADAATLDRDAIAQVASFAKHVGQGFERLIVRKKLSGFSGSSPQEGAPRAGKIDLAALAMPEKKKPSAPPPVGFAAAPTDKRTRAEALGRALFTQAPAQPAKILTNPTTSPETPSARGAIPPVLAERRTDPEVVAARDDHDHDEPPPIPLTRRTPPPVHTKHISERPPPPQIAVVRRTSGPPIPREEPDGGEPAAIETARVPDSIEPAHREPESAEVETETLDDAAAQALLAEIGEQPLAPDGEEVLVTVPDIVPPPPESSEAISIGPHLPPTAHSETSLPSIIVDIAGEISALVERVISGIDDGQAEAELLRQGASAMPAIMARFPGPLRRARAEMQEPLPRATDCGPLLRLIARQRKVALPYVLEEAMSPDVGRRFWGTFLLTELPYGEGARVLVPRLFDPDPKVRLVARAAGRAMATVAHDALLGEISRMVRETDEAKRPSRTARLGLLEALGDMREAKAVALLIGYLTDEDAEIAVVARRSLIAITRQDFGTDSRRWLQWWGQNSARHRIEWLIDALTDETQGIRRAAGDELKGLTHETFGYYDDLPKRERERAQQRFRDWWASEGKSRFVRS